MPAPIQLGLEVLLKDAKLKKQLKGRKIGVVGHPASVDHSLKHSLDLLMSAGLNVTCAFGPQHGMRGEKQDNMIESDNFMDPLHKIPVFSLYGEVRRPTSKMLEHCDLILFDLQDVGCRIYTFLTTLFYVLEDCAKAGKAVWVLDRPNPAGRVIEGTVLSPDFFSFVGGAEIVMRHGLTLGEAGQWYIDHKKIDVEYRVVKMKNYKPERAPDFGWPAGDLSWVNPSPNMPQISTARMYAGTVLIEGTRLSEGRGTTRPLELIGAPGLDGSELVRRVEKMIPQHLKGVRLRPCFFEPTFQKHRQTLCSGFQIHIDQSQGAGAYRHAHFRPYRIVSAAFKAIRSMQPDFDLWLPPPYEYERIKMPIDILSGDSFLREWVDDPSARWSDFERRLSADEASWRKTARRYFIY
jgi:uncharacterized protein YbbC (DUF1343 family)